MSQPSPKQPAPGDEIPHFPHARDEDAIDVDDEPVPGGLAGAGTGAGAGAVVAAVAPRRKQSGGNPTTDGGIVRNWGFGAALRGFD